MNLWMPVHRSAMDDFESLTDLEMKAPTSSEIRATSNRWKNSKPLLSFLVAEPPGD